MGLFSFLSKKKAERDELYKFVYAERLKPLVDRYQKLVDENEKKAASYEKKIEQLSEKEKTLQSRADSLHKTEADLETKRLCLDRQINLSAHLKLSDLMQSSLSLFADYPIYKDLCSYDFLSNPRIYSAATDQIHFLSPIRVAVYSSGSNGSAYKTSLDACECADFTRNHRPCKHMYHLALHLGLLSMLDYDVDMEHLEKLRIARDECLREKKEAQAAVAQSKSQIAREKKQILEAGRRYQYFEKAVERLLHDTELGSPWLAKQFADLQSAYDGKVVDDLLHKAPPAKKAADKIQRYAKKNRALQKQVKQLEYQIGFYTAAFPWLDELTDVSPDELYREIQSSSDTDDESQNMLAWLSPEEYEKLSDVDKFQLVLDRWRQKPKTKWEIGIGFERFVGYQYELQGYSVVYNGARAGLADLGRDLIVRKGNEVTIVQCKRWAAEKTIHEKHIYQLYGTVAQYQMEHPEFIVSGRFLSTCPLSDVARALSNFIGISYDDQYPIDEIDTYPMVKCNISKSGNKIYHLPVDQQYDTVAIKPGTGECYVATVAEAEALGFRRAMRHAPK